MVKLLGGEFNTGDSIIVDVEGDDDKELVFKMGKKQKKGNYAMLK